MSKHIDKEPAEKRAPIPPMSQIEADRKQEVAAQVRAAVETVLTKGGSVSAAQLTKWGSDGQGYFFRVLRGRITKEMSKITEAAPNASPTSGKASNGRAKTALDHSKGFGHTDLVTC